nr:MAG TPA: hypothetical protein [Caudoviricetes sp.]
MFKYWKEYKRIHETIGMLKQMQVQNITDDYSCGLHNGLELALAVVENREPEFATYEAEPVNIETEEEQETGRTVASGIRRSVIWKQ